MAFVLDMMHVIAATLLAVVGLNYEREEDCAPVHFEPVAYVATADVGVDAQFMIASQNGECEARETVIVYPVL